MPSDNVWRFPSVMPKRRMSRGATSPEKLYAARIFSAAFVLP
jgi:hypothetical protein